MDLRQLEYFAAVARHGHFTRAAEELYVTQPALSQQIRRLEQELGIALLHRTPQGVEVTPAGADLLARAEAILAEVSRARAAMDEHAGVERGVARAAAAPADAVRLPAILAAFGAAHPRLHVALRQGSAAEVAALAQAGTVDVAVVALAAGAAPAGVDVIPLAPEPLVVIAAAGDALGAGGSATFADLRDRPLVLPERGSALRESVMAACQAAGFSPVPPFEVADPATVRHLVSAGLAASVVPASWLDAPGPEVARAPLASEPAVHRPALLVPAAGASPAGRLLVERLVAALG